MKESVLWGLVSLVLLTGVVFVLDPNTTKWPSLPYTSSNGPVYSPLPSPSYNSPVANISVNGSNSQEMVVGVSQVEEALTQFSSPNQTIHNTQQDEPRPEDHKTTTNGSNIIPVIRTEKKQSIKLKQLEAGLTRARAAIKEAPKNGSDIPDSYYVPRGPVYLNSRAFHRSYLEMEKQFKVFIYEEGEPPLFHNGPGMGLYSTEGNFIHMLEVEEKIRTRDPEKAHLYFLPFSIYMMVRYVHVPKSSDFGPIKRTVADYIDGVSKKYPYWNRSLGADHFMLSCHDWAPLSSKSVPNLFKRSIRVLCNANTTEGFFPSKDVSLPEINLLNRYTKVFVGGHSPSQRPILAFFAGGNHGPVRPRVFEQWENKDPDIQVNKYLPKNVSYHEQMKKSKYCLCPSGYEVASPRIVEALYAGCVPVLISDHYVLPFSDVLNWKSFSVEVPLSELPKLKNILTSISQRQYIRMQRRAVVARRHFELNSPPKRFDVFNMILHSIWLRRLNIRIHD